MTKIFGLLCILLFSFIVRAQDSASIAPLFTKTSSFIGKNTDSTQFYLDKLIPQAKEVGNDYQLAWLLVLEGKNHLYAARYEKAFDKLTEAELAYKELDFRGGLRLTYSAFGNLYYSQSKIDSAIFFYLKTVPFDEERKDSMRLGGTYTNLATMFLSLNDEKKAAEYFNKGFDAMNGCNTCKKFLGINRLNFASLLDNQGKDMEALQAKMEAYSFIKNSEIYGIELNILVALGNSYYKIEDSDSAWKYIQLAEEVAKNVKYASATMHVPILKGSILQRMGRLEEGAVETRKGLVQAFETKNPKFIAEAYHYYSKNCIRAGFTDSAYKYFLLASDMKDSVNQLANRELSQEMDAKYEAEKKSAELLKTQIALDESKFKQRLYLMGLALLIGLIGFVWWTYRQRFKRNALEQELKMNKIRELEDSQRLNMLSSSLQGQESERARIAKDLHDGLGNMLTSLKLGQSNLANEFPNLGASQSFKEQQAFMEEAFNEMKSISYNLMPSSLQKLGLDMALKECCSKLEINGIQVEYALLKVTLPLESNLETTIFRIVQEIFSNILKHSQATRVNLQITEADDTLYFICEDNGIGFDISKLKSKSLGLSTIQSRVLAHNGSAEVHSGLGKGTTHHIEIPLLKPQA